jgi:acetyltransferase-like isoleucine patch superfamily enzyme
MSEFNSISQTIKRSLKDSYFSYKKLLAGTYLTIFEKNITFDSAPLFMGNIWPKFKINSQARCAIGKDCHFLNNYSPTILDVGVPNAYLEIGDSCFINEGVRICATLEVVIGSHTMIADGVIISDNAIHEITPNERRTLGIHIGSNVWICSRATLLPGVKIGNHSVVATERS